MSNFPKLFNVRIIEGDNRAAISNIAIRVTLFATRKNDYHFIPSTSNQGGIIVFTKDWLEEEILKEQNLFIMDYSSKLEDCKPAIEICVMNAESIENAAKGMEIFADYFKYTKSDIEQIRNVDNRKYKPISKRYNISESEKSLDLILELDRL